MRFVLAVLIALTPALANADGAVRLLFTDGTRTTLTRLAVAPDTINFSIAPDALGCGNIIDGEAVAQIETDDSEKLVALHPLIMTADALRITPEGIDPISCAACSKEASRFLHLVGLGAAFNVKSMTTESDGGATRYAVPASGFTARMRWQRNDQSNRANVLGLVVRTEAGLYPVLTARTAVQLAQLTADNPAFAKATGDLYAATGACLAPLFNELARRASQRPEALPHDGLMKGRLLLCHDPDRDLIFSHLRGNVSTCGATSYRISEMDYLALEVARAAK